LPPGRSKPAKGHRIGVLVGSSQAFVAPYIEIFRQALRALGYVEGGNIAIEYRYADGKHDRLPVLAADLVRLKVDIIVTEGTPPTRAASGNSLPQVVWMDNWTGVGLITTRMELQGPCRAHGRGDVM